MRIGMIHGGVPGPRARIARRLQHAGDNSSQELDVHLGRVHDLEHVHQVPRV